MVSLVEEEVAVTPYFLQLKADLCFFKSSSFFLPLRRSSHTEWTHRILFPAPQMSERSSHTCFLVGREKSKQAQGPDVFLSVGEEEEVQKIQRVRAWGYPSSSLARRVGALFSASYFH